MMQTKNQTHQITVNVVDLVSSGNNDLIHILHVDDDVSIQEITKQILIDMGNFEIDHSSCVDDAFKKLKSCNWFSDLDRSLQ